MIPNKGPKNAPKVSIKDKIPIWLKKVNQNIPTIKPITVIINPALLIDREKGKKFTKVYWDGIKFAIKFVDAEAIPIKTKARIITSKLSNFPRISVGFVNILFKFLDKSVWIRIFL